MASFSEAAKATFPRDFDLSYSTTLEEVFEKLNARAAAFQMPFSIKGGIPGQRIVFAKEPDLDVTLWLYVKDGTHIKIQPSISESKTSVNGIRVDKNSALRFPWGEATVELAVEKGLVADAAVWSDAMDAAFAAPLAEALRGCRFAVDALCARVQAVDACRGYADDLCALLRGQDI